MNKSSRTMRLIHLVFLFAIVSGAAAAASAQVVYDWRTKTLQSYPRITRTQIVRFRVENVNDVLYKYSLEVTQTPIPSDGEWATIAQFVKLNPTVTTNQSPSVCLQDLGNALSLLKQASTDISNDPKLPEEYAKSSPHTSVPLKDSLDAWASHAGAIADFITAANAARASCSGSAVLPPLEAARAVFVATVQSIDGKARSSHEFIRDVRIATGNNISVAVREMFNTEQIDKQTFTFPGVDALTLSAGALFTRIPDRSYEPRKTPASATNVLDVEGNSRATPGIVALLNYSLGAWGLDSDTAGLALSAGPVVRFGSQGASSSFGFFTGISGHLHHRIYVTPGFHFGQFADFPVGFSNGSTIPANFGELTPVKRWTTRFGLAITFKTKDFSSLTSSSTVKTGGDSGSANPGTSSSSSSLAPGSTPASSSTLVASLNNLVSRSRIPVESGEPAVRATDERSTRSDSELSPSVPVSYSTPARSSSPTEPARLAVAERADRGVREIDTSLPAVYSAPNRLSASAIHIVSVKALDSSPDRNRIVLIAASPISDYSMYFRDGRFCLIISRGRLDSLQDGLQGSLFRDVIIERHGDGLALSFALAPGSTASVVEKPNGLDVLLTSAGGN